MVLGGSMQKSGSSPYRPGHRDEGARRLHDAAGPFEGSPWRNSTHTAAYAGYIRNNPAVQSHRFGPGADSTAPVHTRRPPAHTGVASYAPENEALCHNKFPHGAGKGPKHGTEPLAPHLVLTGHNSIGLNSGTLLSGFRSRRPFPVKKAKDVRLPAKKDHGAAIRGHSRGFG